jgi:VanZ family protein
MPNLKIEMLGGWDFLFRKIAHLTEFGVLSILLYRAINHDIAFWPLFLTFVYAVTDEVHQYYVPGRITSAVDIMIDTVGGVLGLIIYLKIRAKSR